MSETTQPDSSNTITLALGAITPGWPMVADDALSAAIANAIQGGNPTTTYFNDLNNLSLFWAQLAAGLITLTPGISPQGDPILMASSGNIDFRAEVVYAGGEFTVPLDGPAPVIGTLSLSLGVTGLQLTQMAAMTLAVTSLPPGTTIDQTLFIQLLPSIYTLIGDALLGMASSIAEQCQLVNPSIDPAGIAASVIAIASSKTILLVGAISSKLLIKFMQISFKGVLANFTVFGALAAVPLLLKALGHAMTNSVLVYNLTSGPLAVNIQKLAHGRQSLQLDATTLPGIQVLLNPLGDGDDYPVAYSVNCQQTNSNDFSAIGLVLNCGAASSVISIPWAGTNSLWIGPYSADADALWNAHSSGNNHLNMSTTVDSVRYTAALNALSGKTDGSYFYCVLIVAQPA